MNAPHDETPPPGDDAADAPFDRGRLVGDLDAALAFFSPVSVQGRVNHAVGQILNATGIRAFDVTDPRVRSGDEAEG